MIQNLKENELTLQWETQGPTTEFLEQISSLTDVHASYFAFLPTSTSIILTPPTPIITDPNRIQIFSKDLHWVALIFPFRTENDSILCSIDPIDFTNE
jgi:hypothetical protein